MKTLMYQEKLKRYLTYDIRSSIYMTNEEISQYRTNSANQRGTYISKGKNYYLRGCCYFDKKVWCVQTTSISIYSTSTESRRSITCSRTKGGFHRQTSQEFSLSFKNIWQVRGEIPQPFSYSSFGDISSKRKAWLNRSIRYKWFTASIDWRGERFHKPIVFWCPRGNAPRVNEENT